MSVDWIAKPGGQLLGCYLLVAIIFALSKGQLTQDTVDKLLFLIVGAVLRDMQDSRASSQSSKVPNSPGAQITTVVEPDPPSTGAKT